MKLSCRDALVKKVALLFIALMALDGQLVMIQRDGQLLDLETGDGQRDTQLFASIICTLKAFDIIGGIAITRTVSGAVEKAFDLDRKSVV